MAAQDYVGSLAQTAISYTTIVNLQTVPGQNYWQVGLFVDSVVDAPTQLISGWSLNVPLTLYSYNFSTYAVANSILYNWLNSYFTANPNGTVFIVVYNGITHDIPTAHAALLSLSYFKMVFFGSSGETIQYQNDVVNLAGQANSNKQLSQALVSTSNSLVLLPSGSGYGNLDALILSSGYDAMMTYSAVTAYNSLLTAIGVALSVTSPLGNPVGDNLDYNATNTLQPSTGSTTYVNLTAPQVANLTSRKIGYFATVGDGTGNVYMNCRLSLKGSVISANWLVNYCNFTMSVQTATLITSQAIYPFKNNATYQAVMAIISSVITPFQTKLGRLSNLNISSLNFSQLPPTGGTVLTIPNAWSALYNDRVGSVNVNGTLSVTL